MRRGVATTVVPYDPLWPEEFARVRAELATVLADRVLSIDHVGSTSVPGLPAKPIIDISVAVPALNESLSLVPALQELGFTYRPDDELPDRHYLPRTVAGLRRHHVSLTEPDSWHRKNSVVFRDALRREEGLAREYARLKRRLAASSGADRLAYLNGKTDFILGVLRAEGLEPGPDYPTYYSQRGTAPKPR